MAGTGLTRSDARIDALRDTMSELLNMDEPRKRFAAMMSGLDIRTTLVRDTRCSGAACPISTWSPPAARCGYSPLLHDAGPVLFNLGEPGGLDITPWADRVQLIDAKYVGTWELPALGAVTAPTAVLIRPDGYVGLGGKPNPAGAADALTTWFGPLTAAWRRTRVAKGRAVRSQRSG